ncbi:hypothetical protein GE253_13640 [Niveispirillum sp. SYP-B3756]|uniref:capsular polysaccharide export protein, LipB/KpsS family n=1 Tax=Niveispirillum sp. SYP-B3756 TaxID=2662178 RepID=UPI0012923E7E|nr:hypothetical protein [Niveispirillum sp. SYP-B3756]MQP66381.1 hypothetical protein [Niveispirillum sp. SYP-B3756]
MHLLIYVEPHPVRNGFMQHNWIAHQFAQSLSSHWGAGPDQVRLLVNRHVGEEMAVRYPDSWPHFICPSSALSRKIDEALVDWASAGLDIWAGLLTGTGPICALYEELLDDVKQHIYDFDTILLWGDNGAVRRFAARHHIQVIHMELGPTRIPFKQTVMFDPEGTNGNASLSQLHIEDIRAAYDHPPLSTDVWRLTMGGGARPVSDDLIRLGLGTGNQKRPGERTKKSILIPLQLSDDANVLLHSPYKSPLAMLQALLPKLQDKGVQVLIKPHPAATHRPLNVTAQDKALRFARTFPNVTVTGPGITNDDATTLLRQVDGIVTLNSSVGFESLLFNKKLCVIGESPYKIKGVFPDFDSFINDDFDKEQYDENIKYLVDYFLTSAFWSIDKGFDFKTIQNTAELFTSLTTLPPTAQADRARLRLTHQATGDGSKLHRHGRVLEMEPPLPAAAASPGWNGIQAGPKGELISPGTGSLPLLPTAHIYFIDTWQLNPTLLVQGWAFDQRTLMMPKRLFATLPGRILWSSTCSVERPGAQAAFALNTSRVGFGFSLQVQLGNEEEAQSLRVFAVNDCFQATELLPSK